MVHSAYDCVELVPECPAKIESVEAYGSKLLLGCSDGSLRIFAPETEFSSDGSKSYALERNLVGFAKKPVLSMAVVESRELLISLSESIAFHKLPSFETIAVITKAKGANIFCWDHRRGFLCFARQKRVCIFRHDGNADSFSFPCVSRLLSRLIEIESVSARRWQGICGGERVWRGGCGEVHVLVRREYMFGN